MPSTFFHEKIEIPYIFPDDYEYEDGESGVLEKAQESDLTDPKVLDELVEEAKNERGRKRVPRKDAPVFYLGMIPRAEFISLEQRCASVREPEDNDTAEDRIKIVQAFDKAFTALIKKSIKRWENVAGAGCEIEYKENGDGTISDDSLAIFTRTQLQNLALEILRIHRMGPDLRKN